MSKTVFIDKDGTLINDIPYNVDPARIMLAPGVGEGLSILSQHGFKLVVVSNQAGIAKGYFEEGAMVGVYKRMEELFAEIHVQLEGFYYCPHHPEGMMPSYARDCGCRKPLPGMIHRAASLLYLNLKESWMIGDILNDVEAGNRAGCRTILINNGNETEWVPGVWRRPDFIVPNFLSAAKTIVGNQ